MHPSAENPLGNQQLEVPLIDSPSKARSDRKLPNRLLRLCFGAALLLFICSSGRHALFQSAAFDLGIYDQVAYQISQGLPAASTILGVHHMGNHGAWAFYPVGLLYKIYPSVHWLFAIQALGLALGMLPVWALARQVGLSKSQAMAMAWVYLLYPVIFNVNLFDFHPEVMAIAPLLTAIWAARAQHFWLFTLCILWVMGCKDVLSLGICGLGLWLLLERRWKYGAIALILGSGWFLAMTQVIIPHFKGGEHLASDRYAYLGDSVLEMGLNLLLKPQVILGRILSFETLGYLLLLAAPVLWGLSWRHLQPMVAALPILALNILSEAPAQRDLVHQYALPILPFLLLCVMEAWHHDRTWLKRPNRVLIWSLIGFLALAKFGFFSSKYLERLDTWGATREAIAQIRQLDAQRPDRGAILTTTDIAPHLTHREQIQQTFDYEEPDLQKFDYVLLNLRYPGWGSSGEYAQALRDRLQQEPNFEPIYSRDDVILQVRQGGKGQS